MNLKLFEQNCSKALIIFLRDFDPKRNKKEVIEKMILNDLYKIWDDIQKPDKFKDSKPENFFSFEFIALPHKVYLPKDFENKVLEIKSRLNKDHPQYLFKNLSIYKSALADGLKQYIEQIWNVILSERN